MTRRTANDPLAKQATGLLAGLLAASVVTLIGIAAGPTNPAASASPIAPRVTPASGPALALDAPDPDVVLADGSFFAFATGTTWGNQIAVATTSNSDPAVGWDTVSGGEFGSSAFAENDDAAPPAPWEVNNTPTSPGVFQVGGQWVMFYDAEDQANGLYCISVATAQSVTGPYTDSSSGPILCQAALGGSIDPQPFIDPATGDPYLIWKSNDGTSASASTVWSQPLGANGVSLIGSATAIFTIASSSYSWQTTTDDPSMAEAGGNYYLFFSGGNYLSGYYPVGYVVCNGPSGPCAQDEPGDPILSTAGGSGGGNVFSDASGSWWISYQTWTPSSCTNYGCGGKRELYVAPISLPAASSGPPPPGLAVQRISGSDAVGTAIAVSQAEFPAAGSAGAVVLARSDFFSDALAGGPLAAKEGGPLLITPGAALATSLDPRVQAEITRVLAPGGTVFILGGDVALSSDIDASLQALGYRTPRIAGSDQYATAVAIAEQLGNPTTIFEATGLTFPDALSAVPAAIESGGAILLTQGNVQSPTTAAYLATHPGDTRYAIGGPLAAFGADPGAIPVYGTDLFATSAAVATAFFGTASTFGAATGLNFPDALAGGVFMGTPGRVGPVLLVEPTAPLPPSIASYLDTDAQLTHGYLFGGPLAVGDDVAAAL